MALVTMKELLLEAERGKYGIGMFDFYNLESLEAIIDAAEARRSPIILGIVTPLWIMAGISAPFCRPPRPVRPPSCTTAPPSPFVRTWKTPHRSSGSHDPST